MLDGVPHAIAEGPGPLRFASADGHIVAMPQTEERDAAAVRVIPPTIPVAAILIGAGLNERLPLDLGVQMAAPVQYWLGGAIIVGSLLILGLWPVVLFRRSGQSEMPWTPTSSIVERGPYRFTRNPMYLQMVVVCIGFAVLLANLWIFAFTPFVFWALQTYAIRPEEAYLERKFGDAFRDYKRRVRRWI